jgi:exonuclease III
MCTGDKLVQLLAELENIVWDVILLSEVRTPSQKSTLDGGHVLYTSLRNNMFSGTGILLHAKHVRKRNILHDLSDRVLGLDFSVNKIKVRTIAVYLPHCGYTEQEYDTSIDQLKCILGEAKQKQRRIILGGDFNSQIGVGIRGATLHEIQSSYGLILTNDSINPWEEQWTF